MIASTRLLGRARIALLLFSLACAAPQSATAQGTATFPTKGISDKPQSKLWYNGGFWWCCVNNMTKLTIYKLDSGLWSPKIDLQNASTVTLKGGSCDVLWDGTNLFVAVYDATTSKIYKLSYNAATQTYAVLAGFPVSIAMRLGAETLVIDKDSTGRLWLTFEAESNIYVMYSTSADHKTWVAAPLSIGGPVDPDDISTLVAFGGNKIGVCWSDQRAQKVSFRTHRDSDPPATWQATETIRSGYGVVDDHLNIKADSHGRVYLAAKDYFDAVWVGRRETTGTWSVTTGASGLDCGTRPILQIDEASNKLHIFYTRWAMCVSSGTHAIEERVAYLDNLLFSLPTVVIAKSGVVMNEVQGTKQLLPAGSLAILCEGNGTIYWTGWGPISGIGGTDPGGNFPPPPAPPSNVAATTATESPTSRLMLCRMDEGTGNKANDTSGNNHHLTLGSGFSAPHWVSGVTNGGLYFDGDDYATTGPSGLSFTGTSFTLESWVKVDLTNAAGTGLIIARADTIHSNYDFTITGDQLRLAWSDSDTSNVSIKGTGSFTDGAWHHVAGVYDFPALQGRVYVDGVQKATKPMAPPVANGSWNVNVGAMVDGVNIDKAFLGSLDMLAVSASALYNGDFTPPFLYPASAKRYVRLTWSPSSSEAGISGYKLGRAVNGGASSELPGSPTSNTWFADLNPLDGFVDYAFRSIDGLTQQGSDAILHTTYESNPPATPSAPTGLGWTAGTATVEGPAFWELDEGSGATSADGTGLGHTLQLGSSVGADTNDPLWSPGPWSKCLTFDGTNDYTIVPDASDLRYTTSYTIECWVRRTKLNSTQAILNKDDGSSKRNYGILIMSNGTVEFSWSKTSGSTRKTNSTIPITDMEWHHIACVYDGPNETNFIYIDGAAAGSSSVTGTPYTGSEPIMLGARNSSSPADWFKGDIDLVRISSGKRYTGAFTPPSFYRGGKQRHVVLLHWSMPASGLVKNYNLYRQPLPSGSNTLLGNIAAGTPSFTDVTAVQGQQYRYTVRARNSSNNEGPASTPLDLVVPLPTDAGDVEVPQPLAARLRIDPNPFNPQAIVSFRIDRTGPVSLDLYDARGRRLDTLVQQVLPAGVHHVRLMRPESGVRLASGVYFVRLQADGVETRYKAVLVK